MFVFCFGLLFVLNYIQEAKLVNICTPDEFPCNDGSCVEKLKWCDSREDCDDDSDENYCLLRSALIKNPNRCNETVFFLCGDGQCIPSIGRCDGYRSCFDNSDEENCDPAETVSSTLFATQSSKAEGRSVPLINNSENLMQSLHMSHTEMETVNKSISYSIEESDTSDNSSNADLMQIDHEISQANVSLNVDVSTNATNQGFENFVLANRQEPLEFRDISRRMLNISRNEQNATTINSESSRSVSLNKSCTVEPDTRNKTKVALEVSNSPFESPRIVHRHNVHKNLQSSQETMNEEFDMHKGYVKLQTRDFRKSKENALQWLIKNRDQDYGWGEETARALITLWMGDYSVEKSGDMTALMSKQLHLKLFTLMSRNETKRIPLGELAVYINALSASCDNPRNFHGHDLINILRHRTNFAQEHAKFVAPFVYLVLCLNDEISDVDVIKVLDMIHDSNMTKTDTEAVISLTATCISRTNKFSSIGIEKIAAKKLYSKVMVRGLPRNIYELSLLTQALNEAKINQDLWNRSEAMHRITGLQEAEGSFGDILSTYYAVPILCGKSFLWIGKHCHRKDEGLAPVEVLKNGKNEKMYVHYTLRFGNPLEMSQSLMIKVQKNTSFLDIMRIAATLNPAYKFKYDENEGKLTVYSIGGIANDAERGLYWSPYTSGNSTKLEPFEGDIRNFIPVLGEYVAFWWKPMF